MIYLRKHVNLFYLYIWLFAAFGIRITIYVSNTGGSALIGLFLKVILDHCFLGFGSVLDFCFFIALPFSPYGESTGLVFTSWLSLLPIIPERKSRCCFRPISH